MINKKKILQTIKTENNYACGIFVDFQKCFDKICS